MPHKNDSKTAGSAVSGPLEHGAALKRIGTLSCAWRLQDYFPAWLLPLLLLLPAKHHVADSGPYLDHPNLQDVVPFAKTWQRFCKIKLLVQTRQRDLGRIFSESRLAWWSVCCVSACYSPGAICVGNYAAGHFRGKELPALPFTICCA